MTSPRFGTFRIPSNQKDAFSSREIFMRASSESACFIISRYPYVSAVLLMIITGEQSKTTELKEAERYHIYFHIGLYFVSATMMAYDLFRLKKVFALVNVIHTIFMSYLEYEPSRHGEHVALNLLIRNFAIVGSFLMFAGGINETMENEKQNKHLISFGIRIIGAFAMLSAVLTWNSNEEIRIYSQALPAGLLSTYIIILSLIICGVSIYSGYHVVLTCKILTVLLLIITLIVDLSIDSLGSKGNSSWIRISIACRHVPPMAALLLVNTDC